jgi:hypothetical protein
MPLLGFIGHIRSARWFFMVSLLEQDECEGWTLKHFYLEGLLVPGLYPFKE